MMSNQYSCLNNCCWPMAL